MKPTPSDIARMQGIGPEDLEELAIQEYYTSLEIWKAHAEKLGVTLEEYLNGDY